MSINSKSYITKGIRISVEARYIDEIIHGQSSHYFFEYMIAIRNETAVSVQLLERHWNILDMICQKRVVKGIGVIGLQPIILPYEEFAYKSRCILKSPFGRMSGYYTMIRNSDGQMFPVIIPTFNLITNFALN